MIFTFDGTYEGLLSAIFESYRLKVEPQRMVSEEQWQGSLFEEPVFVATRPEWAQRVEQGIKKKCSIATTRLLYRCFLSEQEETAYLIYDFIKKAMRSSADITSNYGDDTVLQLHQINKKIGREVHRMHAFVRFQCTSDNIYYAVIEPDFNVLPLLPDHFEKRYPAQQWLIYDSQRHYGIFYNLEKTEYITFSDDHRLSFRQLAAKRLSETEPDYQIMWKSYFDSVNITERKNPKLHLQHVPRRYWKYLSEKRAQF
jgi:probable DNA metabolism protein